MTPRLMRAVRHVLHVLGHDHEGMEELREAYEEHQAAGLRDLQRLDEAQEVTRRGLPTCLHADLGGRPGDIGRTCVDCGALVVAR